LFFSARRGAALSSPFQHLGSSHRAVLEGRWVSPFLGYGCVACRPFGGGRSLGLGEELGPEASGLENSSGETFGDNSSVSSIF
jgi:hypothetical protein